MRLIGTYSHKGRDAFTIIYSCRKNGDIYEHDLETTLPYEALKYVNYKFFMRMTPDYHPRPLEAYKMMEKLADEIRVVEQFKAFYFPKYLLFDGKMLEEQLVELMEVHKEFKLRHGSHFSANTNSLEFSSIVKELYRFKIFNNKKFENRFMKTTRRVFEAALSPGRMADDYIELYTPKNSFYVLQQDRMKFFFLCNEIQKPLMVIVRNLDIDA